MARLVLDRVSKIFAGPRGEGTAALTCLSLEIADGELLALVGPSGSGKTTALRLIAGLETPDAGRVVIGEEDMTRAAPQARNVGMVFQGGALYPHLTTAENLALGLRLRRVAAAEIALRVREVAGLLGLSALLERHPGELSGGERQRVALGRALASRPQILLLDEPLAALDAPLRAQLRGEIARLHCEWGGTTLHVTHDQAEALALGDRVAVLRAGELQQVAPPAALYHKPANLFVAGFIGSPPMNLVRGRLVSRGAETHFMGREESGALFSLRLPAGSVADIPAAAYPEVTLGVRPEDIVIAPDRQGSDAACLPARVERLEFEGANTLVHLRAAGQVLVMRAGRHASLAAGEALALHWPIEAAHWFDSVTGRRL